MATPLGRYAHLMRDVDPNGAKRAAKALWQQHGIAVIMPGDCEKMDKMFIEAVAVRLYGKRGG